MFINNKRILIFYQQLVQETNYVRAIFHPIVGTLLALELSSKGSTLEMGYEATKVKDTGLYRLSLLSYPTYSHAKSVCLTTKFACILVSFKQL
jgi:hypothetical protein